MPEGLTDNLPNPLPVEPLTSPPSAAVELPGSKSITNRALVCAALADGTSELSGVLFSDDTEAMLGVATALGATVEASPDAARVTVRGVNGSPRPGPIELDVRMSGTTARFSAPLAARGKGTYVIDGHESMRARPMDATVDALRSLGVSVDSDHLPMTLETGDISATQLTMPAARSSQFASGMLLAAPGLPNGLTVQLDGPVVSVPYLEMTASVMQAFGSHVAAVADAPNLAWTVPAGDGYHATDYQIEPDASAASYFLAAAAVTGGTVRIDGLGSAALQGDVGFARVLEQMGAIVDIGPDHIELIGPGQLNGIEVDMADISDTAQSLAAIAPFADSPVRVTGIGFIRAKETDRIAAVVTELQRMGIDAVEEEDGFVVNPGTPQAAVIQTYEDHRMAMSFAITGLVAPGISIADPQCVNKTFPSFWETLETLRQPQK